jgi:hypothetical protein
VLLAGEWAMAAEKSAAGTVETIGNLLGIDESIPHR